MTKTQKKVRFWGRFWFILYLILACYFMFFSEGLDRTMVSDEYRYNLTPFSEIKRFWAMRNMPGYGWHITVVNLLGNIVCFMPFGFLLPTISKSRLTKNFFTVTVLTAFFSLFIETAQLLLKVGAFDVDDLLLNSIGGLLGYILLKFTRIRKHI